jgi:hypothetical protein
VLQLYQLDAIIVATLAAMGQTRLKAGMVTTFDYRFALVPQLKSFMKVCIGVFLNVLTSFLLATIYFILFWGYINLSFLGAAGGSGQQRCCRNI